MAESGRHLLICSCDGTVPLDADAIRRGCRGEVMTATQLCRAELDRFNGYAAYGRMHAGGRSVLGGGGGNWARQSDRIFQHSGDRRVVQRSGADGT